MRWSRVVVPVVAFLCTGQIALAEPFVLGAPIAQGPVEVQASLRKPSYTAIARWCSSCCKAAPIDIE